MDMDEDLNKTDADSFEDGLRQILSHSPPGGQNPGGKPPTPRPYPDNIAQELAAKAEAERKTLFWFKLIRLLAVLTLLALLTMFVLRITAPRGG